MAAVNCACQVKTGEKNVPALKRHAGTKEGVFNEERKNLP
jgi:hypothetical protein